MKKLIPILLVIFALTSCEKDPDLNKLVDEYLVYTNKANDANFSTPSTFYIAPEILIANGKDDNQTLTGEGAEQIINAISTKMKARGYTEAANKDEAELAISVTYMQNTYYYTDYGYPNWGWGPGGYWGNYWGWNGGFNYPYAMTYSITTNSFVIDMGDQGSKTTDKMPIWWSCYMVAPAYSTGLNATLAVNGVNQAFNQSPYIKK